MELIELDGAFGEGGGQILRTALALSAFTGNAFSLHSIRKGRCTSGLAPMHLECIRAAQKMCNAQVTGAELGSEQIVFSPKKLKGGTLKIDVGTAGSVTLLLQALLVPALAAPTRVRLKIRGGTDVKWSMPIEYFTEIVVPQLRQIMDITVKVLRRGYYPAGGGEIEITIRPKTLNPTAMRIENHSHGAFMQIKGVSHASRLLMDARVAERQAKAARLHLSKMNCPVQIREEYSETDCPGSGIMLWGIYANNQGEVVQPFRVGGDALGERGKRAEDVGREAAEALMAHISAHAPVDEYLADNLIPFLALFGGKLHVTSISEHTKTNIAIVERFLGKRFLVNTSENIIEVLEGYFR